MVALRGWGGVVFEMVRRISGTSWRWRRRSALGDALPSMLPSTFPGPLSVPVRVLWSPLVDILSPSHRDRRVIRSRKVAASRSSRVKCLAKQHPDGSQTVKVVVQRNSRKRRCNRFGDAVTGALPSMRFSRVLLWLQPKSARPPVFRVAAIQGAKKPRQAALIECPPFCFNPPACSQQ